MPHVGCICCFFSPLLPGVFLRVLWELRSFVYVGESQNDLEGVAHSMPPAMGPMIWFCGRGVYTISVEGIFEAVWPRG